MTKRFEVLKRTTPILRSYFLEASAGTGKTFAIEHIAVRSLLEAKESLTIDEILLVTFTRAATRELKMRLRTNFVKTAHILQHRLQGPDYLQPIFEGGEASIFSALRKIEEALCQFDKAQVFTLHGFCNKMLKEAAFEAQLPFEIEMSKQEELKNILSETVKDYFRTDLAKEFSASQLASALKKCKDSFPQLIQKIMGHVQKGISIQKLPTFIDSLESANRILQKIAAAHLPKASRVIDDFQKLSSCYKKILPFHELQVEKLGLYLERGGINYEEWDEILFEEDYFLFHMHAGNRRVRAKPLGPALLHFPGLFEALHGGLIPLVSQVKNPEAVILSMASRCLKKWSTSAHFQNTFTPDEILKKMASALKIEAFRQKVSAKYKLAIIDEFQDTDPMQWEIFRALFLQKPNSVQAIYLVGDPKQSIYAFRNADVYTYLQAVQALGEENRVFLDTNYRARPELVKALNVLFNYRIARNWMQLPSLSTALEVREVFHKEGFFEEGVEPSLHFFVANQTLGRSKAWPNEEVEEKFLFPFMVKEVLRLKKEIKKHFSQFAILVKDRYQARRLQDFFKRFSIPCSFKKNIKFKESLGYLALYDFIEALQRPEDLGSLKKFLGGALIGFTAREITGQWENPLFQEAKLFLFRARVALRDEGWGALFQFFLYSRWGGEHNSIVGELLKRKDTSLYFETRQLVQILMEESCKRCMGVDDMLLFLQRLPTLDEDSELIRVVPEEEEDQISIMTIHASKGLEFDIVFALGLCYRHTAQEDHVRTKEAGKENIKLWDPEDDACKIASLEGDAEKMRHLYVALTRAKSKVYVPICLDKEQNPLKRGEASAIELLVASFGKEEFSLKDSYTEISQVSEAFLVEHFEALKKKCSLEYTLLDEQLTESPYSEEKEPVDLHFSDLPEIAGNKEYLLSFTSLSKMSGQESLYLYEKMEARSQEKSAHTLPLGASTGTLLHRVLELTFEEGLHSSCDEEKIRELICREIKGGALEQWDGVLLEMVKKTLCLELLSGDKRFELRDIKKENIFLEMEFAYPFREHILKGFVDLVFKKGDKYYLIDWKSNFLGPTDEDYTIGTMEAAMRANHYFLQAAIYMEALSRYLALFEKRSFDECFGGAFYIFLRGNAVYHFKPDLALIEAGSVGAELLWT